MNMTNKSKSIYPYRHLVIIVACFLITALSFSIQNTPSVKADLPGPYYIYGYIKNSTSQAIPSGITVTVTNTDTPYSSTTTTLAGGAFAINVGKDSGFDCNDGNQIVVNCSYNSEVGENATTIDVSKSYRWCNLTEDRRLEPTNISIDVTPGTWAAGSITYSSYNSTINTYFTLTNNGNIKINVRIHGYNVTWGVSNKWNLTSSVGLNNYTFTYQKQGGSGWTAIGLTNSSFVTNLQYRSDFFGYTYKQNFGLNISYPTSSSPEPSVELNTTVMFWSIEA